MNTASIAENFDKYFRIIVADSEELKQASYRIRHQVYSEELGWEPLSENGLESDVHEEYAYSLLLEHKRTGTFAGTVRYIVPQNQNQLMPIERHLLDSLDTSILDISQLQRGEFGEVSRMAVPNSFRRRINEQNLPFVFYDANGDAFSEEERRNFPNIAMGLYLGAVCLAKLLNHQHTFLLLEPRLRKRIKRLGLDFQPLGQAVDFHGIRCVYFLTREHFIDNLNAEIGALQALLEKQIRQQLSF